MLDLFPPSDVCFDQALDCKQLTRLAVLDELDCTKTALAKRMQDLEVIEGILLAAEVISWLEKVVLSTGPTLHGPPIDFVHVRRLGAGLLLQLVPIVFIAHRVSSTHPVVLLIFAALPVVYPQ